MTYPIIARKLAAYLQLDKRTITIETTDLAVLLRIADAAEAYVDAYDKATYEGYDSTAAQEALWAALDKEAA